MAFTADVAKLAVVAELATATIAGDLVAKFSIAYIELSAAALPAVSSTDDAERAVKYRVIAEENARLASLEIDKFLRSAKNDDRVFAAMQRNFQGHNADIQKHYQDEIVARNLHTRHSIDFARLLAKKLPELGELNITLLLAVRRDLGQIDDAEGFRATQLVNQKTMLEAMHKTLDAQEKTLEALKT